MRDKKPKDQYTIIYEKNKALSKHKTISVKRTKLNLRFSF